MATMRARQTSKKPLSLGNGASAAAIRARKKAKRLTPSKLLWLCLGFVLSCYLAMTMVIVFSDTNPQEGLLDDETLYQKKGDRMKDDTNNRNANNGRTSSLKSAKNNDRKNVNVDEAASVSTTASRRTNSKLEMKSKDEDNPKIKEVSINIDDYPLRAFVEPVSQEQWEIKPLPVRNTTSLHLKKETFGKIACSKLPQQWPTSEEDAPTNKDPFLPWIHDVFPSADGTHIQFVSQNKRRCQTGSKMGAFKEFFQPAVALFQHVPVTRIKNDGNGNGNSNVRYRISSHEEADEDAVETRFICRFKPSMEETLSVHNLNYDYHTMRKGYKATFTKEGMDTHMIWSSQLLFKCPVPKSLQEKVRLGKTVTDDFATDFVDLIPIRTPPRYGRPTTYLPPRLFDEKNTWDPKIEWGDNQIVPKIEESGRWENIPICKPTLMTYPDDGPIDASDKVAIDKHDAAMAVQSQNKEKKKLIACTWTSSSFETRGGKTRVSDGDQRLLQWLEYNKLVGVDHVYVYDNSGAFSDTNSLKPITDLFPGFVTRINWNAKICNNNPGNRDNKGERSSQYAAAMSCHLRFGAHSEWLASYDTDEYMTPLGKHNTLKDVVQSATKQGIKVLNWKSKRSKPRLQYFNTTAKESCVREKCFDTSLPTNKTFLEVYNCNIERAPRKNVMPAEKAIYRPDYVVLFFVHYATATQRSIMGKPETLKAGKEYMQRYSVRPNLKFVDEETEGTMLHTKAIVEKEIRFWEATLSKTPLGSKIGVEWPKGKDPEHNPETKVEIHGKKYRPSCYPVEKIDNYWVPKLTEALSKRGTPKY